MCMVLMNIIAWSEERKEVRRAREHKGDLIYLKEFPVSALGICFSWRFYQTPSLRHTL